MLKSNTGNHLNQLPTTNNLPIDTDLVEKACELCGIPLASNDQCGNINCHKDHDDEKLKQELDDLLGKHVARLKKYYTDKQLTEMCGLDYKDVCEHESDGVFLRIQTSPHTIHNRYKCLKCGEFYR